MNWLYGISITCFAASYLVVFGLEISRVFFRAPLRRILITVMTLAGLFAHSVYLSLNSQMEVASGGIFMSSWSDWCLAGAWLLTVGYLWIRFRQPESQSGLFVLPMILLLIGVGTWQSQETAFSTTESKTVWNAVHGISLLLGTSTVILGFVFGVMYLLQARRLKLKIPVSGRLRYPSLEWLQGSGEISLLASMILLGLGLISGVMINVANHRMGVDVVPWSDPVIVSSALLFGWLLVVSLFNLVYRPARQGRKVAYLVLASFVFLVIELGVVMFSGHVLESNIASTTTAPVVSSTDVGQEVRRP